MVSLGRGGVSYERGTPVSSADALCWDSDSHGARPVHPIITMIMWIRTSRLSIKNFLSADVLYCAATGPVCCANGSAALSELRRCRTEIPVHGWLNSMGAFCKLHKTNAPAFLAPSEKGPLR